jgi:O-antigen ligase
MPRSRAPLGPTGSIARVRWRDPVLALAGAIVFGWLLVEQPRLALLPLAIAPAALVILNPPVRVVLLAFGPIVVFGGSPDLTPQKQMFLVAAAAAAVGSFLRSRGLRDSFEYHVLRPLFAASTAFFLLALLSFFVAHLAGVPLKSWLRDISPYLLFATAPYFALDAATTIRASRLRFLLVSVGLLGAFAFAVTWSNNRGITHLPVQWIGFPTVLLPAALASYATAAALQGRRHTTLWIVLAATCFSLLASTGTRSALVLLGSPVAIVLAAPRGMFRRVLRLSMGLPLAALMVVGLVISVATLTHANTAVLRDRSNTFFQSGSQVDRSYLDRLSQSRASLDAFKKNPLIGIGPGSPIAWRDSFGKTKADSTVDSSLSYLTKFGLLGLLPLLVLAASYWVFVRQLSRSPRVMTSQLALVGFGAVTVLWAILNVPFEDKGLPVGFMLLAAIATVEFREALASR